MGNFPGLILIWPRNPVNDVNIRCIEPNDQRHRIDSPIQQAIVLICESSANSNGETNPGII